MSADTPRLPVRIFPTAVHKSLADLRRLAAEATDRHDPRLRRATPDEMALAETQREPHHCTATSSRTGLPCRNRRAPALKVCRLHGGGTRHAKKAAARRLHQMVDPMLTRLYELALQDEHKPAAVNAVRDALDRAGIGELVQAKVRAGEKQSGTEVVVNIGFLG